MDLHSPPPPIRYRLFYFYFLLQVFFKDTLYFLFKYVLPPVLFTLTQVVLLLITSTSTRVQIQSNLGTTAKTSCYLLPKHCFKVSLGKHNINGLYCSCNVNFFKIIFYIIYLNYFVFVLIDSLLKDQFRSCSLLRYDRSVFLLSTYRYQQFIQFV
jgi:hypothetical protein